MHSGADGDVIASISATSLPSCSLCSAPIRTRDGDAVRTMTKALSDSDLRSRAWAVAAAVVDPEIPVLTIADLGVLREVRVENGAVEAIITPTYSGCPAMDMIAVEVGLALERAGFRAAQATRVLSPAWTTD